MYYKFSNSKRAELFFKNRLSFCGTIGIHSKILRIRLDDVTENFVIANIDFYDKKGIHSKNEKYFLIVEYN